MAEQEMIPLNITIGDRNYRIRISPGDEGLVRKTLKVIADKIIEFRAQFAGKDMQDYIAMVLIWYATQPKAQQDEIQQEEILAGLQKIGKLLEKNVQ